MVVSLREIDVRSVAGNSILACTFRSVDTIKQVKKLIQKLCCIPFFQQELLLGSTIADDAETLARLPHGLFLTLVVLPYVAEMARPLLTSASSGDMLAATQALKSRADPNCADEFGRTPLYCAASKRHNSIVGMLCQLCVDVDRLALGGAPTALAAAAARGHLSAVVLLVGAGADKDIRTHECVTPLWLAARHGHVKIVRYLCRAGADINKPAPQHGPSKPLSHTLKYHPGGSSPIWIAAADNRFSVVRFLYSVGANCWQPNQEGITAVSVALRCSSVNDLGGIALSCYLCAFSFATFFMNGLGRIYNEIHVTS